MTDFLTMSPAARAALISPDPTFRSLVIGALEESAPSVEWVLRADNDVADLRPESVDRLAERRPDLLFLDVGSKPSAGVRYISAITTLLPGVTVVAAGGDLGVDELLELIRAGASGYLRRPWSRDEAIEVCSSVLRKIPSNLGESDTQGSAASHVVTLFTPKGGTGVSTLATNLAVRLHQATEKPTLLVDLSPELGTCPALMGLEPRYSYLDVVESLHRMDERLLHSYLEEHESGTWLLAAPDSALSSGELSAQNVGSLFRLLRRFFAYIVVDTGRATADEPALNALQISDVTLVVTTAELPALRNVKQVLPHLPSGHDPDEEGVRVVVNRYEEGVSVPPKDVERAVGVAPFEIVREERERLGRSVNLGKPVVMAGSSSYLKSVNRLVKRIAGADIVTRKGRSPLGGLLRSVLPSLGQKNGMPSSSNGKPEGSGSARARRSGREAGLKPQRTEN